MQKFKVVIVGPSGVGKTSIINRYCFDIFHSDVNTTVGIDYMSKKMVVQDKTINFLFWDTAGQEKYKSLVPSYIRDCDLALAVFDATSQETFDEAKKYVANVREIRGNDAMIAFIGNKIDLLQESKIEFDAAGYSRENNLRYFEVSAKEGTNINSMFQALAEDVLPFSNRHNATVVLVKTEHSEKKCFC